MALLVGGCSKDSAWPTTDAKGTPTVATLNAPSVGGMLAGGSISSEAWNATIDSALDAVVRIDVNTCDGDGVGSGFFVDDLIITNRHVLEGARALTVSLRDGQKRKVLAWGWSRSEDLGWVRVDGATDGARLSIREAATVSGDLVAALGYPLGRQLVGEPGRVLKFDEPWGPRQSKSKVILTTTEVLPGNSGGPLLDTRGRAAGIIYSLDYQNNIAIAVPGERVAEFLQTLPDRSAPSVCS